MAIHLNKKEKEKLKKFVYFLKKKNIYEKYLYNLNHTQKYDGDKRITVPRIIRHYSMRDWIYGAFYFNSTPEVADFWYRIEKDWSNFMYYSWDKERNTYNNPLTRRKK